MAMEQINADIGKIRGEMGTLQRHQLRVIPELRFYIDDSLDYIDNIDKLLKE